MANAICLLSDICRLCLDEQGKHNIFENDILVQDILMYTGILHMSCEDKLPQSICSPCLFKIEAAKDLRNYTAKNDSYMKSLLSDEIQDGCEVARPKVQLNSKRPLEELVTSSTEEKGGSSRTTSTKMKRAKISVRSLSDINNSINPEVTPKKQKKPTTSRRNSNDVRNSAHNGTHKCDVCGKTCATSKKLYLHRRSHTKKIYCPLDACGKSFATKGDLQKHIRSHTGEKPYQCDLCDKSFSQNVTLKQHKDTVHVEKHN